VLFNKLRPGDLLYFGRSPEKITHTGMYIGHGQFINATTYQHPVVQISRLKEPRWTKLLVAARRLRQNQE
jgi:cell wall-associated NlpC family hydrolase